MPVRDAVEHIANEYRDNPHEVMRLVSANAIARLRQAALRTFKPGSLERALVARLWHTKALTVAAGMSPPLPRGDVRAAFSAWELTS